MKTKPKTKYIFVTGGVISGLGKGITAASLGKLLTARGLKVTMQKCDPYLNMDAGTLNPAEHGEVFVTSDGGETDLDLGHYERFIDRELTRKSSTMSGRVYSKVIADERKGMFLGKTIQIIPHITNEIMNQIISSGEGSDVHIAEVGGTVGDYEAMAWIESIRQMKRRVGEKNVLYAHVVYVPYLAVSHEFKTKPAQNSVRDLREAGVQPDILCIRSDEPINAEAFEKMSLYCDVDKDAIVALPNAKTVYEVPLRMEETGIGNYICSRLLLSCIKPNLKDWHKLVDKIKSKKPHINIGVVAKYMTNEDTYLSVFEAVRSAGWHHNLDVNIIWVDAEKLTASTKPLDGLDGIVVPGGFGSRGVEGKIAAARYARVNSVPYLGLCLGMQVAVIEFARQVLEDEAANSSEIDPNATNQVIHIMPNQVGVELGGTMRLGDYQARIDKNSRSFLAYGTNIITERHRHRYEFNNQYSDQLKKAGLVIAATSPDGKLVEIIEHQNHPFFVASQFHPEYKSRPNRPHPLFRDFVQAIKHNNANKLNLSYANKKA
ncbi:MAG: CTP synthase [Patescibacteria group bacterium]|jgi:CTP synthase|nr:CTP synthase [Patescibacteria group bacterium]